MVQGKEKRATIKDIAKQAGVSNMAVSLALNGKPGLSAETREKICRVARELNYVPNNVARSLQKDQTHTLGVVNSNTSATVFGKVWRGIEQTAEAAGYTTLIASTDERYDREQQAINNLLNRRVDGLLIIAPVSMGVQEIRRIQEFGIPLVFLLRRDEYNLTDACLNDNVGGAHRMMCHLLEQGCRTFLFLALPAVITSGTERMMGYARALKEHGIEPRDQKFHITEPNIQAGYEAMRQELEQGTQVDAVVCACDMIAIGALKALREAHIGVPDAVRVVGYDDVESAEHLSVPLTTVHQPYEEIGQVGTQLLLERMKDPSMLPRQVILGNRLELRASSMKEKE
ncbi:MAG: LacI family DNA-binding transcriptional regulator [Eubacteriales bacterium]|jgi:LacI family transcriptional regulator